MKRRNRLSFFVRYGLFLAWMVSLISVAGSFYFSEMEGFLPCQLCWIQRIFMYPLAIILGIATYINDNRVSIYVLPLSVMGGLVSVYHYLEQKIPFLSRQVPCTKGIPCNVEYINWFGFITIPFLSMIAFLSISILMGILLRNGKRR